MNSLLKILPILGAQMMNNEQSGQRYICTLVGCCGTTVMPLILNEQQAALLQVIAPLSKDIAGTSGQPYMIFRKAEDA